MLLTVFILIFLDRFVCFGSLAHKVLKEVVTDQVTFVFLFVILIWVVYAAAAYDGNWLEGCVSTVVRELIIVLQ